MIRRHQIRFSALAATLIVAAGVSAFGSVFLRMDVQELRKASEAVVHARVSGLNSYWDSSHRMIFTDVTLEVKRRLHGLAGAELVVRVPGGTVDGYTAEMPGAPEFDLDEEVVLFVSRWKDGAAMVTGYSQGKARVVRDQIGNETLQGSAADGLPMVELVRQLCQAGR